MNATTKTTLSDELIGRCGSRAAAYDRDNRFFTEDFEELRAAGYLKMAVPEHLGGPGMTLLSPGHSRLQGEPPDRSCYHSFQRSRFAEERFRSSHALA